MSTLCVSTLCVRTMCEHSMCVSTLTISHITSRKKRTQRRSSWAECLGRIGEISPHHTSHIIAPHQTSDITSHHITHHKPKEEHTEKKFLGRVLGPDRRNLTTSHITHHCISPDIRHHISPHHTSQAERREHKEEVLGPSSWAGWHSHHITHHHISPHQTSQAERHNLTTSHITHHCISVLGPDGILTTSHIITSHHIRHHKPKDTISPHHTSHIIASHQTSDITSHHITHHKPKEENTKKKFLGRVLGPDGILTTSHIITSHHIRHHKPKGRKSTSFIVKTLFKSIPEERKVRELPRKMNIEEVEQPKKYENYHAKPVSDPFKSIAEHRKVR